MLLTRCPNWLRQEATSYAASQIVATPKKIMFLLKAGVDTWELAGLTSNRVKWLAQLGWKAPTYQLQRMAGGTIQSWSPF